MFKESYPTPEPTKYLVSEDDNFELKITHDVEADKTFFIITPKHIRILPGIGVGKTLISALQNSRQEMLEALSTLQSRIRQLDQMIEEEMSKMSESLEMAEKSTESTENEKPADTPNAAGSSNNTSPSI